MAQEASPSKRQGCLQGGLLSCGALVVPELTFKRQQPFALRLDQPLIGPPDVRKLIALCAVADAHVERAMRLKSVETFDESVLTAVEAACTRVYSGRTPEETLEALQLFDAFPYLRQGFSSGKLEQVNSHAGTSYFSYVSLMNQLVMMATQVYHDACQPEHHKYIAHQMALLYQCLNQLQGDTKPIRRVIESKFEEVKAVTESKNPFFGVEISDWLQEISWLCREEVKCCPPYIHKRLQPMVAISRHAR